MYIQLANFSAALDLIRILAMMAIEFQFGTVVEDGWSAVRIINKLDYHKASKVFVNFHKMDPANVRIFGVASK